MKQKLIISFSLILLLGVIYLMWKDFFVNKNMNQKNPYEYNIDNLKHIDPKLIDYTEVKQIKPDMENPLAIAIDKNDQVYITGKNKVILYTNDGNLISSFNIDSTAYSININTNGDILLGILDHIEIRNNDGKVKAVWEAINEKSVITSIATSKELIFVADAGNKVVYKYNMSGQLINKIGLKDTTKGTPGFIIPSPYFDLLIGNHEKLWVVNPGRHAFEKYNFDGDMVSSWDRTSMQLEGFSGCCNPTHIALLSDGSFVTSEKGLERVKIHFPSGDFKSVVAGPKSFKEGTRGLDLAVDSNDKIYVLDPVKKLIRIFEKNNIQNNDE